MPLNAMVYIYQEKEFVHLEALPCYLNLVAQMTLLLKSIIHHVLNKKKKLVMLNVPSLNQGNRFVAFPHYA